MLVSWEKSYVQPRQHIKKQRHYFANNGLSSHSYGFSRSRVWMGMLDYKENWVLKNLCFWTLLLETTLEGPLDCKEIKPVHPKENQSRISIGRTDTEAETLILCQLDVKNWLIWKDPDAGKDWSSEEKGTTVYEMIGWHHQLYGYEFEKTSGAGHGQERLECCSPWVAKSQTWTWLSDWAELTFWERGDFLTHQSDDLGFDPSLSCETMVMPYNLGVLQFPPTQKEG